MRQLLKTLAVDDSDILQTAQSDMREAPEDGEIRVWYGSDQADGTLTVIHQGINVLEKSNMPVITVGQLKTDGPPQFRFKVTKGGKTIMTYDEITGGTATILIVFFDLVDLLLEQGHSPIAISNMLRAMGKG